MPMRLLLSLLMFSGSAAYSQAGFLTRNVNEHADILIRYEDNELEVEYEFEDRDPQDNEFALAEVLTIINQDLSRRTVSSTIAPILGLNAGDTFYFLPPAPTPGLPYIGWAAGEDPDEFADFGPDLFLQVTSFSGPGNMAIWFFDSGNLNTLVSTVDGLDGNDQVRVPNGAHVHYSIGFTTPGRYFIDLKPIGTLLTDEVVEGENFRLTIDVANPAPAPGSLMLLAVAAPALAWVRRRRRA